MNAIRGLVNRTLPFSAVDGPGNRFVVFMQGCNLNCITCHNPHTIGTCNLCGICVDECPAKALRWAPENGGIDWEPSLCRYCDTCLEVCPIDSTPHAQWLEVEALLKRIIRVAPFLSGITVSGGEAARQPQFVRALFEALRNEPRLSRLTTFIDTNGIAELSVWQPLQPLTDGVMIDLKSLDGDIHRQLTGDDNEMVQRAIRFWHEQGKLHEVRLLLIPGVNDDEELLNRTARWLSTLDPLPRLKLIGFRRHGVRERGLEYVEMPVAQMIRIHEHFLNHGFEDLSVVPDYSTFPGG